MLEHTLNTFVKSEEKGERRDLSTFYFLHIHRITSLYNNKRLINSLLTT